MADVPPQLTAWKPGQSGNPGGRRKGERYPGDYLRHLLADSIDEKALRAIARTKAEPPARRIAARAILECLQEDGKIAGPAIDRLLDRTEGRPGQTHRVIAEQAPDAERILAEAQAELLGWEQRRALEAGGEDG